MKGADDDDDDNDDDGARWREQQRERELEREHPRAGLDPLPEAGVKRICEPGETQPCRCPDIFESRGVQTCDGSGRFYDLCVCE